MNQEAISAEKQTGQQQIEEREAVDVQHVAVSRLNEGDVGRGGGRQYALDRQKAAGMVKIVHPYHLGAIGRPADRPAARVEAVLGLDGRELRDQRDSIQSLDLAAVDRDHVIETESIDSEALQATGLR